MSKPAAPSAGRGRIASVEWMRVFFVFCITLGHVMEVQPQVNFFWQELFHSGHHYFPYTGTCVEFFFILAGYFLYSQLEKMPQGFGVFDFGKKLYLRLAPAFLTMFALCVLSGFVPARSIWSAVPLLSGLSVPGDITGWGDWFVGVYFWMMLFYFLLLTRCRKAWPVLALPLIYLCISAQFNTVLNFGLNRNIYIPLEGNYFGWLGEGIPRGFVCIGIGFITAQVGRRLRFAKNKFTLALGTALEVLLLGVLAYYLIRGGDMNRLQIEFVFAVLLLCLAHSAGLISAWLNKWHGITRVSKYTYGMFIMQIFAMRWLISLSMSPAYSVFFVFGVTILLAVAEYHLVEKRLVPWLGRMLRPEQKENKSAPDAA